MPQEVHVRMAQSAKKSYIASREDDEDDIMSIMMRVADDLESNWREYDADAFVNQWDIANYISDYLTQRVGAEGCECSSKIHWVDYSYCEKKIIHWRILLKTTRTTYYLKKDNNFQIYHSFYMLFFFRKGKRDRKDVLFSDSESKIPGSLGFDFLLGGKRRGIGFGSSFASSSPSL